MVSPATIATIRFGYGLGPGQPAVGADDLLSQVSGPDRMIQKHKAPSLAEGLEMMRAFSMQAKAMRKGDETARKAYKKVQGELRSAYRGAFITGLSRIVDTDDPLRERLVWFWADHFTAVAKNAPMRGLAAAYIDEAIRPHVTGNFSDMLRAVVTHPFMLNYLDQIVSIGPNSKVGKKRNKGLNENLAREVLELHTLGVSGTYGQKDVRGLAELMTGLSADKKQGFVFRQSIAEPGPETVLGQSYGGDRAKVEDVFGVMDDIAVHPDTAHHIARKLAVHFVSQDPDPDLVAALEFAFAKDHGNLLAVYDVLLNHRASAAPLGGKAKAPFDFIASSLVALGFTGNEVSGLKTKDVRRFLLQPMVAMGQPFMNAPGPDGWSERAEDWITPQGLATRITWAMGVADRLQNRAGDPREFLETTLGDCAGKTLRFAASAAQTRAEGVGIVLASAEFNRR